MTQITEYHRPSSLEEALGLLGRGAPTTRPLAGGTHYRRGWPWSDAVVDLSALNLEGASLGDQAWVIGATTTLDQLASDERLSSTLRRAAHRQAPRNTRQRATIGGAIATRDSGTLLVCLLALDATLMVEPGRRIVPLASYLREPEESGRLITACLVPTGRTCAFEEISRTPADAPILVVAVGAESGAAGLGGVMAACGGADQPVTAMPAVARLLDDAPDPRTIESGALSQAAGDLPWRGDGRGTAAYRTAMTPVLLKRAVSTLLASQEVSHAS